MSRPRSAKLFGLGMDLSWNSQEGFLHDGEQHYPGPSLQNFLKKSEKEYDHFFFSLQPMNFDLLFSNTTQDAYFKAYDRLFESCPNLYKSLSLHHTFLNLATDEVDYPREKIVQFTNKLIQRYKLKWVNEDLGIWSLKGKILPYPLPPILNENCLKHSIKNIKYYQDHLKAELFVEFPGFSEGHSFLMGEMDGFDFFTRVIEEAQASCVLDTGHLLSYQWLKGNQANYLKNLEQVLPFSFCKEIHLSGCSIVGGEFFDFHHGIILDEQIEILRFLLPRCQNLDIVTYEDPKFKPDGSLIEKSLPNYKKLKFLAQEWKKHG